MIRSGRLGKFLASYRARFAHATKVGTYVRAAHMVGRKITQAEMAEALLIRREYYTKIERGGMSAISPELAVRICDLTDLHGIARTELIAGASGLRGANILGVAALHECMKKLEGASSYAAAAQLGVECLSQVLQPSGVACHALVDETWSSLGPRAHFWRDEQAQMMLELSSSLRDGGVLVANSIPKFNEEPVLRLDNVVTNAKVTHTFDHARYTENMVHLNLRSVLNVPLFEGDTYRGVVGVGWTRERLVPASEIEAVEALAQLLHLISR